MLRRFSKEEEPTLLDGQIDAVLRKMKQLGVDHENYPQQLAYLERLKKLKAEERRKPLDRDTIVLVIGNLLGILLIVAYEQKHVMTSRALNQLPRLRG